MGDPNFVETGLCPTCETNNVAIWQYNNELTELKWVLRCFECRQIFEQPTKTEA